MKLDSKYSIPLLVLLILGAYYPTLFAPFNTIDDKLLVQNLINRDIFSWSQHFFPGGRGDYYRPLVTLSYEFDKLAWGLEESFMHLENILVHVLNTVLLYLIGQQLLKYFNLSFRWLPFVAAAIFALHPINTEAVNWITARTDLLAASGVYLSLYGLTSYLTTGRAAKGCLAALAMVAGALAKEPALFFLPGALLMVWWCRKDTGSPNPSLSISSKVSVSLSFMTCVGAYFVLRFMAFHFDRGVETTFRVAAAATNHAAVSGQPILSSPLSLYEPLLKAIGFYFKKIFWPFPLNFATIHVSDIYIYVGILVLLWVGWLLTRRTLVSGILLSSIFLASSALLVVVNPIAWTPVAERYIYIASGPFALALVFALARRYGAISRLSSVPVLIVVLLTASAYATVSRNIIWQDNLTLYQDSVNKSPKNMSAKNELAMALIASGQEDDGYTLLQSINAPENQKASLNKITSWWREEEYVKARDYLLEKLDKPGPYELRILNMLIKTNTYITEALPEGDENRAYYLENIKWLERLYSKTKNPFYSYRIGQVYLVIDEPARAQPYFAKAAIGFKASSPYKKPAEKLANTLPKP